MFFSLTDEQRDAVPGAGTGPGEIDQPLQDTLHGGLLAEGCNLPEQSS